MESACRTCTLRFTRPAGWHAGRGELDDWLRRNLALPGGLRGASGRRILDSSCSFPRGHLDQVKTYFISPERFAQAEIDAAFGGACHGDRQETAQFLAAQGADINWLPAWEPATPLDAAERSNAGDLARWLRDHGARPATAISDPGQA